MTESPQFLSKEKLTALKQEYALLKDEKIPALAKRIDDARQMGDLSENAEYHTAREEMAWVQSRMKELVYILDNAEVVDVSATKGGFVDIGSSVTVRINGAERSYGIVGAQEADPLAGRISNESPLGSAFLGKKKGDVVTVQTPKGPQKYDILEVR
jgi:transcription elongation factor GreA